MPATWILLITLMVQSDADAETGQRHVAVTIHSRDFLSEAECDINMKLVIADYKRQGFRRPSIVCLKRSGLEPELLNEQDYTSQAAPQVFTPTAKMPSKVGK
jgi:hypothetical protein